MITYGIENKTIQEVDYNRILKYLEFNGYNTDILLQLFSNDTFETLNKCEFNNTIRNIAESSKIPMFDILAFIERNFIDGKKIWDNLLDNRNKTYLRNEAKRIYKIKENECSLSDML